MPNGNVPQIGDNSSLASNGSSNTSGSGRGEGGEGGLDKAPVRDNRSDLLQAIREGKMLLYVSYVNMTHYSAISSVSMLRVHISYQSCAY